MPTFSLSSLFSWLSFIPYSLSLSSIKYSFCNYLSLLIPFLVCLYCFIGFGGCLWDWCACFDIFHLRIPRPQDQIGARTLILWQWPLFLPQFTSAFFDWSTHCFCSFYFLTCLLFCVFAVFNSKWLDFQVMHPTSRILLPKLPSLVNYMKHREPLDALMWFQ